MEGITTFDSTKESLLDLVRNIKEGKTQLPDFQRGWVWDDEHVRSLLASVSLSFPIGAVMMLQTGGQGIRFKPRLVEGVSLNKQIEPERLIMDGQQRLTSLYQALFYGEPVATRDERGKPLKRWYYLDINKALNENGDREEAIIGLTEDKKVRNFRGEVTADYSSMEKECAADLFPLPLVFDTAGLTSWQMQYLQVDPDHIKDRLERWNQLIQSVIQRFQQYQVPLILLRKETPKEAVCQVFEKVNTGGVSLTVFELLTATFAVDDFNLREDWAAREKRIKKHKVLYNFENTDFLQAITLLATREKRLLHLQKGNRLEDAPGISCKRKEILRLDLEEYKKWAEPVTDGLLKSAKLLHSQKLFDYRDLPYRTQLAPLASILAILKDKVENDGVRNKLAQWYWCGVLGELYGSAIETRFAKDLPEVLDWIQGGPEPTTVSESSFSASRLITLRTRNSAAYKGIYAILMRDGGLDFRSGEAIDVQMYFDDKIDIHHIFPREWCGENKIESRLVDSIINKTPLSARTNRMIGGKAPSEYLPRIQKSAGIGDERMNGILESHVIDPNHLRKDDFKSFFSSRIEGLLERIDRAMGKPAIREKMLPAEEADNTPEEIDE